MSKKTVEIDALQAAADALDTYIEDITQCVQKMKDAALDCHDNLDNSKTTQDAITSLEESIKEILASCPKAEDLKKKILEKKRRIEETLK